MSTIENIMTKHPVTVEMDDLLFEIRNIFEHTRFHHIFVIEDKKLMGIISDRDLLKAVSPYAGTMSERSIDAASLKKHAHQIMSRKPVTIGINNSLANAARLLIENKISCLPVLEINGDVVGILTWRDVLRALYTDISGLELTQN